MSIMDWDQRYLENDTPWDRGEPAPPLVEFLATHPIAGRVFVPGCGLGYDVRHLAEQGCSVVGADISAVALARARAFPAPSNGNASYLRCDFLDSRGELPAEGFDWVFEHTCFCTLAPAQRSAYVDSVARLLAPAGKLLAILFTDLANAENPPYSIERDEVDALFLRRFEIENVWRPQRAFPGREGEETVFLMAKRG